MSRCLSVSGLCFSIPLITCSSSLSFSLPPADGATGRPGSCDRASSSSSAAAAAAAAAATAATAAAAAAAATDERGAAAGQRTAAAAAAAPPPPHGSLRHGGRGGGGGRRRRLHTTRETLSPPQPTSLSAHLVTGRLETPEADVKIVEEEKKRSLIYRATRH